MKIFSKIDENMGKFAFGPGKGLGWYTIFGRCGKLKFKREKC
jgi:hypothetical protein